MGTDPAKVTISSTLLIKDSKGQSISATATGVGGWSGVSSFIHTTCLEKGRPVTVTTTQENFDTSFRSIDPIQVNRYVDVLSQGLSQTKFTDGNDGAQLLRVLRASKSREKPSVTFNVEEGSPTTLDIICNIPGVQEARRRSARKY